MNIKNIVSSKIFHNILTGVACLVASVLVFAAGVFVGSEKVKFSDGWGENYYRNFVNPSGLVDALPNIQDPFWDKDYINPHGLFGKIIEVNGDGFVITDSHGVEIPVHINGKTIIKDRHGNLKISDLKIDDQAVVIGEPIDRGEIDAKLVRIDNR
jgi:hypothetical protein